MSHKTKLSLKQLSTLALAVATSMSTPLVQAVDDGGVTDYGVPASYAQTSWPTDHHGPRNDDFSQFIVPTKTKIAWENLQRNGLIPGAATVFAGTQGVNGDLFITNARGRFFSQMHGFDQKTGETTFQSPVWMGDRDNDEQIDLGAIAGTPTHDADGNYYVVDTNQFFSYDKDGNQRWVTDLEPLGIGNERIFLNPVITKEGYVGGVTLDGLVAFFNPDDGTLAVPLFSLPGGQGPECPLVWPVLWAGGEVSVEAKRLVYCVFFGYEVEIANTAAVDPRTGRLFIGGSGPTPEIGAMYGLDLVDDGNGGKEWKIAWESPVGAASGASPTISPDGQSVYVTDGNNTLWSFDTETGEPRWSNFGGDAAASPSIDMNGNLFASAGENLISLDGKDGSTRFLVNYDEVAEQFLDPKPAIPFLIPNGNPVARIASVINLSPGKVTVPLSLGYEFAGLEGLVGRALPLPQANAIISVDPDTGEMIPDSLTLVPDGVEGALTPTESGRMGVDQAAIFSSIYYYVLQNALPASYRIAEPPKAGYIGLMPESFREFALEQIEGVLGYGKTALKELPGGDVQAAFDELRRGRLQLKATVGTLAEAKEAGELKKRKARIATENVMIAQQAMDQAAELLLQDEPSVADQNQARELAAQAVTALKQARKKVN